MTTKLTIDGKEIPVRIVKYKVDGSGTLKRYEVEPLSEWTDDSIEHAREISRKIEQMILYGVCPNEND